MTTHRFHAGSAQTLTAPRRALRALAAALAFVSLAAIGSPPAPRASAQPASQPSQPSQPEPAPPSASKPALTEAEVYRLWSARLAALNPSRPFDYFLLGEEIAGESDERAARELARRVFVLAYELNQRSDPATRSGQLAPSVCLALASIARRDDERRWLRALAQSMSEPIGYGPADTPVIALGDRDAPPDVCLDAASVLGLCRAGDGRRAEALLEKPGVYDLLRQVDVSRATPFSIESFIERTKRDWPVCPQCRNRRAVPSGGKAGEMVVCDTCRGSPGVRLTALEMVYQLRLESALLAGKQRSWAAQIVTDAGAPLRDLDASELAATYDVDASKPYWRAGAWSATP